MSKPKKSPYASLLKVAYRRIEALEAELEAIRQMKNEPVAIIGIGCRFPGLANDPEAFWQLLENGIDAITEAPSERFAFNLCYDSEPLDRHKGIYGGFINQVDTFDAKFFDIPPQQAMRLDPQQRLLLEVSWTALESANLVFDHICKSSTGVFVGICFNEYIQALLNTSRLKRLDAEIVAGNTLSAAAGRLSYVLGLTGPSIAIDTACSSSLVAVHLACQSLYNKECDLALAGGVNLMLIPEPTFNFSQARTLSSDGRCKAFDASADGYGRGEGCGMLVLKRLSEAIRDNDYIWALIRGSAVNQNGRGSGLTMPRGTAQQEVIRRALHKSGLQPSQISYIETHGTGTLLGDQIEAEALNGIFGKRRPSSLFIGSVKTNIGHLEGAAGIASLIKVALALQHQKIPPHLHFKKPNPHITWSQLPLEVPTKAMPWPSLAGQRVAGISSFGLSGTNAHILLEEAPISESSKSSRTDHLLVLSAKTRSALETETSNLANYLRKHPKINLADVAYTLLVGRATFSHRRILICQNFKEAAEELELVDPNRVFTNHRTGHRPSLTFMFPGQVEVLVNMGRHLYQREPIFREQVDHGFELLRPQLGLDLGQVIYPSDINLPSLSGAIQRVKQKEIAQPALFVIEYALAKLWLAWGVRPQAMIGHGLGEYVAACLAGVFSLEEGLELVALRSKLRLTISTAFYPQIKTPIFEKFREALERTKLSRPQEPYISNLTGQWITSQEATDPHYWIKHLHQTIRFADGIRLLTQENNIFLEVGPGNNLSTLVREQQPQNVFTSMPHLDQTQNDVQALLTTLGQLWLSGLEIDGKAFYASERRHCLPLPTHPLARRRYWVETINVSRKATKDKHPANFRTTIKTKRRPNLSIPYVAPRNDIEKELTVMWQQLLNVAPIGIHDDFFKLNGHSLLATQLISRVRQVFNIELPIYCLFEAPTIAEFAQVILKEQLGDVADERSLFAMIQEVRNMSDDDLKRSLLEK